MIEDFLHLPPVSLTPVANLELRIPPRIKKKFETDLMVYSGAWGKLIPEKKPEVENHVTAGIKYLPSSNHLQPNYAWLAGSIL
jgi:hypothetical protein